ncbi:MAG: hypothetical protein QM528_06905, partial [Phycisphaerales bacterium]|nr:hypothetical protein [Phycisphaerales bacterium]
AQLPLQPSIKLRDTLLYPVAQLPLQPSIKLRDTLLYPAAQLPLQPSIKRRDTIPAAQLQPTININIKLKKQISVRNSNQKQFIDSTQIIREIILTDTTRLIDSSFLKIDSTILLTIPSKK